MNPIQKDEKALLFKKRLRTSYSNEIFLQDQEESAEAICTPPGLKV